MPIAFDVKTEFERHCGAAVKYLSHDIKHHQLTIGYEIPSIERKRYIHGHLSNGLDTTLRDAAHRIAKSAFDDAYVLTGQRDAEMGQLLQGKTV